MAGKMLMPMQIERMFSGALDSSSVFTTESDRLNYLSSPIAYEGQVVSSTSGEIFVIVKNAGGNYEYVGVQGGDTKFDISESYETMTAGAKPATNKIYYLMNDYFGYYDVEENKELLEPITKEAHNTINVNLLFSISSILVLIPIGYFLFIKKQFK